MTILSSWSTFNKINSHVWTSIQFKLSIQNYLSLWNRSLLRFRFHVWRVSSLGPEDPRRQRAQALWVSIGSGQTEPAEADTGFFRRGAELEASEKKSRFWWIWARVVRKISARPRPPGFLQKKRWGGQGQNFFMKYFFRLFW